MKNKEKKKGSAMKKLLLFLLLAVILGLVIWYFLGGWLYFWKDGSGEGTVVSDEATADTTASTDEPEDTVVPDDETETGEENPVIKEIEYTEITVSGQDYLFQNAKYTLEELLEELKKLDPGVSVKLTDDHSSLNAYSDLKDALSANNIVFIEVQ